MPRTAADPVPAATARRLFLGAQELLGDPTRRVTPALVHRVIARMGFVQVDTINVVQRAHHHILGSRLDGYRPRHLTRLLERDRKLFEHWTHDASVIPAAWYPHWKIRFRSYARRWRDERWSAPDSWWAQRMGGKPKQVIDHVLDRVTNEGPLMSRDFEHDGPSGAWWGWKPPKAALEHLWRVGRLAVRARVNFHKIYDLSERVFPDQHAADAPDPDEHIAWAARMALERLGFATAAEIAGFFRAVPINDVRAWCEEAQRREEIVPVLVETADGSAPRREYGLPDWRKRVARCPDPPDRIRVMSPFDPVLRDRARALRRFGFDYRFEAFVPAPKRRYGYYVLPILEADRFTGRLDAKLHRGRGVLEVRGLWWEPGVRPSRRRLSALDAALGRLAESVDASAFEITAT
ncbi:MAG: winged helix-turn-helix domain-containing protein [Planctomycetes bacterium]|nr:winged helix-turn-helix domain-containing protein [Planctomycetota bacterium]